MPAARVHFTDVDFAQTSAKALQHQLGFGHGRVYLSGLPYVETKPRFGKLQEHALQIPSSPASRFSFVHVFE